MGNRRRQAQRARARDSQCDDGVAIANAQRSESGEYGEPWDAEDMYECRFSDSQIDRIATCVNFCEGIPSEELDELRRGGCNASVLFGLLDGLIKKDKKSVIVPGVSDGQTGP